MTDAAYPLGGLVPAPPADVVVACSSALRRVRELRPGVASIGITSARPGEGRTTIAAGVAVAHATYGGSRTVLLVLDGQTKSQMQAHLPGTIPDSQDLLGLIEWPSEALGVLPASSLVALRAEPQGPRALSELLAALHAQGVFVVADLPPLSVGTDAYGLAHVFDAVVQVVRAGSTPIDAVRAAGDLLEEEPFVLVNRISTSVPRWLRAGQEA